MNAEFEKSLSRPPWVGAVAYGALLVLGLGLFVLISGRGATLTASAPSSSVRTTQGPSLGKADMMLHVMATLAAVVAVGYLLGKLFKAVKQPPVIGEVLGGILLGPSLLGAISPEAMHLLIPSKEVDPSGQVVAALKAVSQLGVVLYMFLVGLELNAARLAKRARATVAISHASIVVPFLLGTLLALGLYPDHSYAGVPFTSFAMFFGIALGITAFPVLARILTDSKLNKTELGVIALGCAAAADVTAWCLLALVVGAVRAEMGTAVRVALGAGAFLGVMVLVVKPLLRRASQALDMERGPLPPLAVSGTFLGVLLCALVTEGIGIHAIFGAFVLGAVIPHDGRLAREFSAKLQDPVLVLLLPAFFAYIGMRTEIHLVSGWENWLWCGAIIVVATVGKVGGTMVAARLAGMSWRDGAALGTLMNARGLMELIVLNIGLELGVISPTLFAMMVIMALVTTLMTAPVVSWLTGERKGEERGGNQEELSRVAIGQNASS